MTMGTRPAVREDVLSDRPLYHVGCDGEVRSWYHNHNCAKCDRTWQRGTVARFSDVDLGIRFYVRALIVPGEHVLIERTIGKSRVTMCIPREEMRQTDERLRP